jgi:aminopeptidase N
MFPTLRTASIASQVSESTLSLIHDFYQHFKYQNIMTEDVVAYFNQQTGMNLTPVFDQYLRHTAIPTLQLKFDPGNGRASYRWKVDESAFRMPVRVGKKDNWQVIQATTEWQTMPTQLKQEEFDVATDLYYVNVAKE